MPRKGHTEEQIMTALRQAEAGKKVGDVCRELGVSKQAFYSWKRRYAGLGLTELRELRSQNTAQLAAKADARSLGFIGVAAIIVAALLFLTIAQVIRTRGRVGQAFFAAGGLLVVFGTVGFVIVELVS